MEQPVMDQRESLRITLPPTNRRLDREALELYHRALLLGFSPHAKEPPISFTVVLLSLLHGREGLCRWFKEQSEELGPVPDLVLKAIPGMEERMRAIDFSSPLPELRSDELLTLSSREVLKLADEWADQVVAPEIGIRHFLAAYLINPPPYHRGQLIRWRMDEKTWPDRLFAKLGRDFPRENWKTAAVSMPKTSLVTGRESIEARKLAWPGDPHAHLILEAAAASRIRTASGDGLDANRLLLALFRLIESIPAIKAEAVPLHAALVAAPEAVHAALDTAGLKDWRPGSVAVQWEESPLSPQLANVLETARLLARSGENPSGSQPGVRHLLGALLSKRVAAEDVFSSLGIDCQALRKAFIDFVGKERPGEDVEVWREALVYEDVRLNVRAITLNSDDPDSVIRSDTSWSSDPLRCKSDIHTFASLIASKSLNPPLSIGLFGPWGSGKSSFMRRLRRAIDQCTEAQAGASNPVHVKGVVHVEFNAWHYAETNLVASLVDSIFRQIDVFLRADGKAAGSGWLEENRHKLASARKLKEEALQARDSAVAGEEAAETVLERARRDFLERDAARTAALKATWTHVKTKLAGNLSIRESGILKAVQDGSLELDAFRKEAARLKDSRWKALPYLRPKDMLGWGAFVLFAFLLVRFGAEWLSSSEILSKALALGAGAVSAISAGLKGLSGAAIRARTAMDEIERIMESEVALDSKVREATADLERAGQERAEAERRLRDAAKVVEMAEAAVADASIPRQFAKLVQSRRDDNAYGKSLGDVSMARADFEQISAWLKVQGEPSGAADLPGKPPKQVDRVVLYIDDLDRCNPEQVVQVLQLVHMLLSFELFVVVVGVDSDWVINALELNYQWLSDSGRTRGRSIRVTAQDYLEKIFQISFRLQPMDGNRAADFLRTLVAKSPDPGMPWEIVQPELDFLRTLADRVGTSPRRVKRLINAYRVIKASLSDLHLENFLRKADGKAGPYQSVLALLVIGNVVPSQAPYILAEVARADRRETIRSLTTRMRAHPGEEWGLAAQVLDCLTLTQGEAANVEELTEWAERVSRYLLHEAKPAVMVQRRIADSRLSRYASGGKPPAA